MPSVFAPLGTCKKPSFFFGGYARGQVRRAPGAESHFCTHTNIDDGCYVYTYIYIYIYMYYVCINVYITINTAIYIYIYMYVCMHIHIYIYICIYANITSIDGGCCVGAGGQPTTERGTVPYNHVRYGLVYIYIYIYTLLLLALLLLYYYY